MCIDLNRLSQVLPISYGIVFLLEMNDIAQIITQTGESSIFAHKVDSNCHIVLKRIIKVGEKIN